MLARCHELANKGEGYSQSKMARDLQYDVGLTLGLSK
jgi:hypothetical protein